MKSLESRIQALEAKGGASGLRPYRMLIGETEADARNRLGLSEHLDVLFIQRVIVNPKGSHAKH